MYKRQSLWHKYRKIYNEVSNEKEIVIENYSYQYTLVVELANKSDVYKRQASISAEYCIIGFSHLMITE